MTALRSTHQHLGFLIFLLALIFIAILAGYGILRSQSIPERLAQIAPDQTATASPTASQTHTETLSPTPSRTPRPTWTLRPKPSATPTNTLTPTATPSPTRIPSITPALPYRYNDRYTLNTWTAESAGRAADLLLAYPEALFPVEKTRPEPAYSAAFQYAVFAYREALLRFPDDPRAAEWQWRLAYSLARVGDAEAASLYSQLILDGLRKGTLRVQDLPEWFSFYEQKLSLRLAPIPAKIGQLSQGLVILEEAGLSYWLIETPDRVQLLPLLAEPSFQEGRKLAYLTSDVTGDGSMDVVLLQINPAQDERTVLKAFTLDKVAVVELPVQEAQPLKLQTDYQVSITALQQSGFLLEYTAFPACPVFVQRAFPWDGQAFIPGEPEFEAKPEPDLLLYCESVRTQAINAWPPSATLTILQALLPYWPPAADSKGRPYPADAQDELRYQIGVYEALNGNFERAIQILKELTASPSDPNSRWLSAARQFLANYQSPKDLYRACQSDPACDLRAALRQLISFTSPPDLSSAQEYLRQAGVLIRSSGLFDFDQDGGEERWLTIRPRPGQSLEFWILVKMPYSVQALYVSTLMSDQAKPYISALSATPPIFQLEPRKGFQLIRLPKIDEYFITNASVEPILTTFTRDQLQYAVQALLSGVNPRQVSEDLEAVLNSGRFNCKTHKICDLFFYTLGLAYELSGEERLAVDTYIKLWWENKNSPYTTLARLKLKYTIPEVSAPRLSGTSALNQNAPGFQTPTASPISFPTTPATGDTPYP